MKDSGPIHRHEERTYRVAKFEVGIADLGGGATAMSRNWTPTRRIPNQRMSCSKHPVRSRRSSSMILARRPMTWIP